MHWLDQNHSRLTACMLPRDHGSGDQGEIGPGNADPRVMLRLQLHRQLISVPFPAILAFRPPMYHIQVVQGAGVGAGGSLRWVYEWGSAGKYPSIAGDTVQCEANKHSLIL